MLGLASEGVIAAAMEGGRNFGTYLPVRRGGSPALEAAQQQAVVLSAGKLGSHESDLQLRALSQAG